MQFNRYAIYYTAPAGALADFGAAWLGWDVATGLAVPHPTIQGLKDDVSELTATPRKYGFHGTVKPPFRLAEGKSFDELHEASKSLCRGLSPVTLDGLELSKLGSFLALTPTGDAFALAELAANIVRGLDDFRAPPTESELARRRKANLSERQNQNLMDWGYPYVMEDFKFHLTLTGRLKPKVADRVHASLSKALVNTLPSPFEITDMTLAGEGTDGRFYEIERLALGS